jgi:MYXO-CTERM domain-containing protein
MRRSLLSLIPALLSLAACSDPGATAPGQLGTMQQAIYFGTADTTSQAVVAVINTDGGACSGTVVAVKGQSGYVLTAAHCAVKFVNNNPTTQVVAANKLFVLKGNDYAKPDAQYPAGEVKIHPSYTGDTASPFDFAMIRIVGVPADLPVIPVLTKAEDQMKVNTTLDLIGYGKTEKNDMNSVRFHILDQISDLSQVFIGFDQKNGGTCQGDSGGPAIYTTPNGPRVAGVTSFGGQGCTSYGYDGRVSAVVTSFIQPFIDGSTGQITCTECSASSQGGSCKAAVDACFNDADCQAFDTCANACAAGDSACQQKCATDHPSGVKLYGGIFDCICDTGCAQECVADPMCQKPACGFNFTPDTCDQCLDTKCCAEQQACADDPTCGACFTATPPATCAQNAAYNTFSTCLAKGCNADCGGSSCGFTTNFMGYPECDACVQATCCDVDKTCYDDPACADCATGKDMSAACDTNAKLNAFTACIYGATCGPKCGGAKCGFTAMDMTCQACFEGKCCADFTACKGDAVCTGCLSGTETDQTKCTGSALYTAAIGCLNGSCGTECGGGAGGAGGAGGSGSSGSGGSGVAGSGTAGSGTAGSGTAGSGTAGSGTAGSDPTGGAGTGTAGSGTAGAAPGEGGSSAAGAGNGEGGSGTGAQGGAGGTSAAGGSVAAGGSSAQAGSTAEPTGNTGYTPPPADSGGCGCEVPRAASSSSPSFLLAGLAGLVAVARRRRRLERGALPLHNGREERELPPFLLPIPALDL